MLAGLRLGALAWGLLLPALVMAACMRAKPPRHVIVPVPPSGESTVQVSTPGVVRAAAAQPTGMPTTAAGPLQTTPMATLFPTMTPSAQATAQAVPTAEATAQPTAEQTAVPCPSVSPGTEIAHTVERHDTLFSLARRYGSSVAAIQVRNNLGQSTNIRVGQILTIPVGDCTGSAGRTHVVRRGETVYSIARIYGVSPQALIQTNRLTNPNRLLVGQILSIP